MTDTPQIERVTLAPNLEAARIIIGLWQVADMERESGLDTDKAAERLEEYAAAGFDTFDMADHYGSAELIAGRMLARHEGSVRPLAFTKWCPAPGTMDADSVRRGVEERLKRLGVDTVDLLQFHWWTFDHPGWLDGLHEMARLKEEGLIRVLGVTNFDAGHLHLALADGVPLATNQVSFSLLDRRAAGPLRDVCKQHGVKLLTYGTLCGGFLTDRWLGRPEPAEIAAWSGMKYKRFIDTIGGWEAYQSVLRAAREVADRHDVSIANVATRWVLEQEQTGCVIIGARLGEREHRDDNARLFGFRLSEADHAELAEACDRLQPIPGDCGDEYRHPPFLTASGDLTHHLDAIAPAFEPEDVPGRPGRRRVSSGSVWEGIAGYSRAVRVGERIVVSGTTATHGSDRVAARGDAGGQATFILDKIVAALRALGAEPADVIRTRILLADIDDWEPVSRAHGRVFGDVRPANTLVAAGGLVGDYLVEIEAEAIVDDG